MNRRYFIQASVAAVALSKRRVAASDKVNLAIMGVRGRGKSLAEQFAALPEVDIPYLCDVDQNVFGPAAKIVQDKKGANPQLIGDIRKALDDKNVDAIVIATPDHWHAPATILGCQAGKDVYVEKPCSHNLKEGRLMVEAARSHQRVVQHGTGYRSFPSFIRAVEAVKAGMIGKALMAKAWDVQMRDHIGHKDDGPVPDGVDFETWTGPAPLLPFNENRFHYKWHWHWNYGTGDVGNDGVHQIDLARWALGVEEPVEVTGMGRKMYFDDDQKTPDTVNVTFEYRHKALMFEMRIWNPYGMEGQQNGVAIYGSEGVMHIGRWISEKGRRQHGYRIYDRHHKLVLEDYDYEDQNWHARNFVDCIRSRKSPNAEIAIGHTSTLHAHLANIVVRTGQPLKFDANLETVFGSESAQRLLGREYRKHWATPRQT